MAGRSFINLLPVVLLPVLMTGCGAKTGTSTHTPAPSPLAQVPSATPIANRPGGCEHPLWPVRDGTIWTYQLTTATGTSEYALAVTVGEQGTQLYAGQTSSLLTCVDGAISGLLPGLVGHPALGPAITGTNPRGALLPAPDQLSPPGAAVWWDQEVMAGGMITLLDQAAPIAITGGRIVTFSQAGAVVPVDVPAGSYSALEITDDIFFEIEVAAADGTRQNVLINTRSFRYFAEGIGLIRVTFEGGSISSADGAGTLEPGAKLELVAVYLPNSD